MAETTTPNPEEKDAPRESFKYYRKSPKELEELAWDIVGGKVFTDMHLREGDFPRMLQSVFMPLTFMEPKTMDEMKAAEVCTFYEYMDKAGPRSINGYPGFLSVRMLDVHDADLVFKRVTELEKQKKEAIETAASKGGGNE